RGPEGPSVSDGSWSGLKIGPGGRRLGRTRPRCCCRRRPASRSRTGRSRPSRSPALVVVLGRVDVEVRARWRPGRLEPPGVDAQAGIALWRVRPGPAHEISHVTTKLPSD